MHIPQVTVFIPTYNRADYLGAAVRSALAQRFDSFEVLVVDDGSTDDTARVLAGYTDPRLRVEVMPANRGIAASHARGLELARGEYFAFLDSDEQAAPDRLARQVAYLERHRNIAAVGSAFQRVDAHGRRIGKVRTLPADPEEIAARLLFHCPIHKPTVTARTAALRRHGFEHSLRLYDDHALWVSMAMSGASLTNLPQVLGTYRRHAGQTTADRALAIEEKKRIAAAPLARLGLAPDDQALTWHVLAQAHNLAPEGLLVSRAFLEWVREWLETLLDANARAGVYDRGAFERVVRQVWYGLVRRARQSGAAASLLRDANRRAHRLAPRRTAAAQWWLRNLRAARARSSWP